MSFGLFGQSVRIRTGKQSMKGKVWKREGSCRYCGKENVLSEGFNDELSLKEFKISGMCQECQDKVFKED